MGVVFNEGKFVFDIFLKQTNLGFPLIGRRQTVFLADGINSNEKEVSHFGLRKPFFFPQGSEKFGIIWPNEQQTEDGRADRWAAQNNAILPSPSLILVERSVQNESFWSIHHEKRVLRGRIHHRF